MRRRQKTHSAKLRNNPGVAEVTHVSAWAAPEETDSLEITYDREMEAYMISCAPIYYSILDALEDYLESDIY